MHRITSTLIVLLFPLFVAIAGAPAALASGGKINLAHLEQLRRRIPLKDGTALTCWYARTLPSAKAAPSVCVPVESETMGLASTADCAVVAMVYLRHWERTAQPASLARAREALETLLAMHDGSGLFRPYLKADGSPCPEPPRMDLATAWAFRALCQGYRLLLKSDPAFASQLEKVIVTVSGTVGAAAKDVNRGFNNFENVQQLRVPRWLAGGRGDVTSLIILGLCDYHHAAPAPETEKVIYYLCRALVESQLQPETVYPYRAYFHSSAAPLYWKLEDSFPAAALVAGASAITTPGYGRDDLLASAVETACSFYPWILTSTGPTMSATPCPETFPQNASCALALVTNLMALHRSTRGDHYAHLAGLGASWLLGSNSAGRTLYDEATGRCSDGAIAAEVLAPCGAGPTARALLSLMEIEATPAAETADFRRADSHSYQVLEAESARGLYREVSSEDFVYPDGVKRTAGFFADSNPSWVGFKVDRENRYYIYSILRKIPIPADWLEILFRVDGGKVLRTTAGGVNFVPTIAIESIGDLFSLDKGLHTLGIQAKGKSMTQKVEIDCFVVQPALQTATFRKGNAAFMIAQNLSKDPASVTVPLPAHSVVRCYGSGGGELPVSDIFVGAEQGPERPGANNKRNNGNPPGRKIRVAPRGYTIIRW